MLPWGPSELPGKEAPPDLEREEGVGAGVRDLLVVEVPPVPVAHRHPFGLPHLQAHHLRREPGEPRVLEPSLPHLIRGEGAEVDGIGDLQVLLLVEAFGVAVDADADEGEAVVGEEVSEGVGDVVGVEEEEHEAAAADAELEDGDGVLGGGEGGAPLGVEADDEAV